MNVLFDFAYIFASILFIIGLKMLSSAKTARKGNAISAVGMLVAITATLLYSGLSYTWIAIGLATGAAIGALTAQSVQMTAMPEMVALFNGFGGIASLLVGWAEFHSKPSEDPFTRFAIFLTVLIGGVTFTGSMIAYAKLAKKMDGKPTLFKGQQSVNALLMLIAVVCGILFSFSIGNSYTFFLAFTGLSLLLGILTVIPIGGADMPVVIALLNSYSGLAASMAGFIIYNTVLIVAGSLVGASGLILTNIMCKAMNRSLLNVLFSGFGKTASSQSSQGIKGEAKPINASDAYFLLEAARSVIFVPGYGMAVAQAQHIVKELADMLEENGTEVQYAIHPVAGRMPGHMNVLLAEANVPYELLVEPKDVNPTMGIVDVAVVIGANDVVNPAAKEDPSSTLYGMPVIDVEMAKTCLVLKRGLNPGFAGMENALFFKENTRMLFGDAKQSLSSLVSEFKK
ncbi:NAD(P) transhydrogenase subunit beta [Waddlia chondrophila 2032/99]|uniref:NAD(P) transhydrogenase subunit beta n=1 Tax=Waddlia chondrophila 2032/99 TaxID=765953 RepID=F8LBK9_9BACT|nr:NAD(P) transhydrogenase subunit beta [Waddlia chondrophila 2032/99]